MIRELRIRGLGVIDEAVVPFPRGLTVLTGETGAGKTMLLTGLALIMGHKADAAVVRAGSSHAEVDGEWLLAEADSCVPAVLEIVEDAGARVDEEADGRVLLLGRTVAAEGRSKATVGGRSVPAGILGEVTDRLVAVHGQADQLLIRDLRRQREVLDRFAGPQLAEVIATYRQAFSQWRSVERELRDLVDHAQDREREAALLRHGIEEIAAVQPVSGEDIDLKAQAAVLAHATELVRDVSAAHDLLLGGDDDSTVAAVASIEQARRLMERVADLDPGLAPLQQRIVELTGTLADIAAELSAYARGVEADPERLALIEERRQQISGLMKKYGPGLDDVLAWWEQAERTVDLVDNAQERIAAAAAQAAELRESVVRLAADLTKLRTRAGESFAELVTTELRELSMPDSQVLVEIASVTDPEEFTADGADTVTFLLRPHPGSDPRPLGKGASGGELSRLMLAIEVVLAAGHLIPTFVFDEVDAGIGGKVAVEVGRRLARLARDAQVIVVTHLPQVAAFADSHVVVRKSDNGLVTAASVGVVEGEARVRELVRMLSGLEDSSSGAEHAEELLALAQQDRASDRPRRRR